LSQFKERHRLTNPALRDLLQLLKILLPPNILPASVYLLKKLLRHCLAHCLGEHSTGFKRMHLCPNKDCSYMYVDKDTDCCPKCGKHRHVVQRNGKRKPALEVRHLGLTQGLRVLLMSRQVCKGIQDIDTAALVASNYSVYSSQLSEQLCEIFIPGYKSMDEDSMRQYKVRFLSTGQVCTAQQFTQHTASIVAGTSLRTMMLLVEGGCDAFQPFKRRVWSTWLYGYRIQGIAPSTAAKAEFEIVTAISQGSAEGKAADVVTSLDAQELLQLCPLPASKRTPNPGMSLMHASLPRCLVKAPRHAPAQTYRCKARNNLGVQGSWRRP
jgi:hypothetical protein